MVAGERGLTHIHNVRKQVQFTGPPYRARDHDRPELLTKQVSVPDLPLKSVLFAALFRRAVYG
jgi:hypothetical protein